MREIKQIAIIGMGKWGKNLIREFAKFSKVKTCITTGNKKNIVWLKENYPDTNHDTDAVSYTHLTLPTILLV